MAEEGGREITLVIGMHRSGTSLCAHMLSVMGLDMADQVAPDGSNPRGHWERAEIVARHDEILRLFGRDWYDERHGFALPPGWWADPRVRRCRDAIEEFLAPRLARQPRIGLKDPRTARLLPMWSEICRDLGATPRFVLCLREPGQVMRSLGARDEIAPGDAELRWLAYNAHAVEGIGSRPVAVIPYDEWFPEPARNLGRLIALLGLPWDPADPLLARAAAEIVDAGLRHDTMESDARPHMASTTFHALLRARAGEASLGEAARQAASAFVGFEQVVAPIQDAAARLGPMRQRMEAQEAELARLRAREEELEAALEAARAAAHPPGERASAA
jgi:hypothetical protein